METPEFIGMTIVETRTMMVDHEHHFVMLREQDGERVLPIFIGPFESAAITAAMQQVQTPRPMTHDLALRLVETLGARVERVVVNKLVESTFYAQIALAQGDQSFRVDARPSDALALAARTGAPIFVARAVLNEAGGPDDEAFCKETFNHVRAFEAQRQQAQGAEESAE